MNSRRRNFIVITLMLALLGASVTVIATVPTKLGFDIAGGLELVYQVIPNDPSRKPTSDEMQKTVKTIRDRVNSLGVTEAEVQTAGADTIYVALPSVKDPARARKLVGSTARLLFYKWEDNIVVGPGRSKSNIATDAAANTPYTELFEAVTLAAKQKASSGKADLANDGRKRPDFYLVDTKKKIVLTPTPSASKEELLADPKFKGKLPKNAEVVVVPRGITIVRDDPRVKTKFSKSSYFVIRDNVELTGDDIQRATADTDSQTGTPAVGLKFTGKGGKIFERVTRELRRAGEAEPVLGNSDSGAHRFAIVLDGESISLASISTKDPDLANGISGGQAQITNLSLSESRDVAKQIELGALPVDLKLIAAREVSASLGKQDLRKGLTAALAGFLLVLLFLLIFYRVLGIIAGIALIFYGILFFALTKLVGFTFTLPGIAGLVLTLSVAADANIVIFERIKEEIRAGHSIKKSISTGYSKGFATIVDANVVTLITAFILFILATAGVRGFAAALGLGTIVSLFTAVLVTSAILGILAGWRGLSRPSALGAGKESAGWRFDFMGASKYFFSLSGVILLIGSLAVAGQGLNLGIDFESGTRINVGFEKPTNESKLRAEMLKIGVSNAKIQRIVNDKEGFGTSAFQISSPALEQADVDQLKKSLDKSYNIKGDTGDLKFSVTTVGPTFGAAIARSAIIAIIFSLLVIGTYIALRFAAKFSVPVIIALMHDILITVGVYALVGREVSSATVAALLTIVGFSLYDTIIVFDRIRENLPRMPRAAFSQIVNRSMSEVLTRSLATSFVTALPITALLFFGGPTLKDFAFALLIGTISGTYSSIFIASPVLTHWKEREPIFQQRHERIAEDNNGVVPAYYVETVGGVAVDHRDLSAGVIEKNEDGRSPDDTNDSSGGASQQGGGTISRASSKAARKASRDQRRHGRSR